MIKTICLIRGNPEENYPAFSARMRKVTRQVLTANDLQALSITITEDPPPRFSVIPFRKGKIAAFSLVSGSGKILADLEQEPGFSGYYQVTEALPVSYQRNWPDGEVTPGLCMLTLFRKKRSIPYQTFLHRWHNGHTPLSLKVHPLWHYNRNVVDQVLVPRSEPIDGIVEEHVKTPSELLNPFKFFGNPLIILWRFLQVYRDTLSFLDYSTIEPYVVREYWVTSSRKAQQRQ
ncbi:MAG: hypothetical protein IH596_09710 [Bacteroidales bacterium]|nr:hypothetical protein [Bacteroidales bacterium]